MNLKTTVTLLVLVAVGGIGWLVYGMLQPAQHTDQAMTVVAGQLSPEEITRIEVVHGDRHVVLKRAGKEWSLPGRWPVRERNVQELIDTLTSLHSRFAPIALGDSPDLKRYGLVDPVRVTVQAAGKEHKLEFGEEPEGETNRYSRPTYVREDGGADVVRLAPGLLAILNRPQEHYMQRRLFPVERVAKDEEGKSLEKVEELAARKVAVKGENAQYTLARTGSDWKLTAPVQDRPEPDKLKKIVTDIPDIWVESFVKGKDLGECGLKQPAETLQVTGAGGTTITLEIGKQSKTKVRMVKKSMPSQPFQPPQPPIDFPVHEEYRYAKLKDNDQVFEIKAEHLKDLFLPVDSLRDPQVARFKTDDVKQLEVKDDGQSLAFVKDKDGWRMTKPLAVEAESSKVTDLLDKLSGLQARDQDVIDKADPKTYGLDRPATIKLTLEEGKAKKTRQIVFDLGKHDTEKKKLYVQVAGQERVNAVADDLDKLVRRPALAYRGRRLLNLNESDLARIDVHRGATTFALEQVKSKWRLAAPVQADVDSFKADQLARDMAHLEAAEFITDAPKKEDLAKVYGLAEPALTIKATLKDAKKAVPTLQVGKKREGKEEYYARLDNDPAVFVVRKDTFETLDRDSLAYRPLDLWQMTAADIAQLQVAGRGPEYTLKREGTAWKVSGPFQATADANEIKPMTEALADLRAERYAANTAKDLAPYGLDRPYLRIALRPAEKKGTAKEEGKERVLLIGKETAKDAKTRYARLGDGEAVFVVGDKLLAAVDHPALDLLDRKLLTLDTATIQRLRAVTAKGAYTLKRDKEQWRVVDSPAPPFVADREAADDAVHSWAELKAQRFAAYGGKLDLASYGLEKPAATVRVTVQPAGDKAKAVEHTLALGSPVKDGKGARYARLDGGPAVVVLAKATADDLGRTYLDFVNRAVLTFDGDKVNDLRRHSAAGDLEIMKRGTDWRLTKPADQLADRPTVDDLVFRLAGLRAQRIAAYPAKDLQPFGLTQPTATLTIRLGAGKEKPAEHQLLIGAPAAKGSQEHFARVDRSDTVFVLPADLADQLLAAPLQFRDRNLVKVAAPSKASVERAGRKAVFAETDGEWKMTAPVTAEAESAELQKLAGKVSRLRADRLIAEKPADLKPFGLSPPRARWRFGTEGKEELTLLVGGMDKDGKRAYAQLEKGELVFLLDEPTTTLVLAEYRDRKVWAALDAVQVDKLHYGYPKGGFDLAKVDGKWQLPSRPGSKVNEAVVNDTLDALARLKAQRYVADKGADRKLFGLEPPALALEVKTTAGKRTLLIGRQEGGTGGYYAMVAGAADAPIFVVSPDAGRKIVRPVQDFLLNRP
jgi:hypothetical protein